jgi:hypothetical protein
MRHRSIGILFLFIFLSTPSLAQQGPFKITGHVMSNQGEVLPGVNILVDEARAYTTDIHGDFSISAINHGTHQLRFTFIGYDTLTTMIDLHSKDVHLDIKMKYSEIELNEVVVLGDHFKTGRVEQSQPFRPWMRILSKIRIQEH